MSQIDGFLPIDIFVLLKIPLEQSIVIYVKISSVEIRLGLFLKKLYQIIL